ncbi:alpha/beta-hydrolase [Obba rivulosa]|uniref:Alpha/beta-hydrolase n=1 Tax=Obba rivulosa TaxID=1052685 RepID=A0A8E2AW63_9APHY|nr:alpha/beta-hydrolase [Obba rivulosa]
MAELKASPTALPSEPTRPRSTLLLISALILAIASVASRFYEVIQYGTTIFNVGHLSRTSTSDLGRSRLGSPIVALDHGIFEGFASTYDTDSFLGIPFAQPPVGDLRFRPPHPLAAVRKEIQKATTYGDSCPQQSFSLPPIQGIDYSALRGFTPMARQSEDCLYMNIVRPTATQSDAPLPVVVVCAAGGFMIGDASRYNGTALVARSVQLGEPIIFVSFNYRVNAFGFLGGKEVHEAGLANLGLRDQRFALKWVQEHIFAFGGDPAKVTAWGQSAGGISVAAQLAAYGGHLDGLFRGAIMLSSTLPALTLTSDTRHQHFFDHLVNATNCSHSARSPLDCLRHVPYEALREAIASTPALLSTRGINMTWFPSIDGEFLTKSMKRMAADGELPKIPLISGNVQDEGTFGALYLTHLQTNEDFLRYVKSNYLEAASDEQIAAIAALYVEDPVYGSPYGTGNKYVLSPQWKRIAALQGDLHNQAPRRFLLEMTGKYQPNIWGYLYTRKKDWPYLGSVHGGELQDFFGTSDDPDFHATDAIINFVHDLDPNGHALQGHLNTVVNNSFENFRWPRYTESYIGLEKSPIVLFDDPHRLSVIADDYRSAGMQLLNDIQLEIGY